MLIMWIQWDLNGIYGIYLPIIKHGLLEHLTFIDDFPDINLFLDGIFYCYV